MSTRFHTLLIDGDVYLHRAVAVATTHVKFDEEEHWSVDVRKAGGWLRDELRDLKAKFDAKHVVIALGDRTANFRKELCPTYKANRTNFPKPPGFLTLQEKLKAHARVVQIPRLEGDDVLGLMATKEPTEGRLVVSVDKDLLQVPGWHYNPDTEALTSTDDAQAAVRHMMQTLTGDRVDGYPGCPGVGEVKAAKILDGADWSSDAEPWDRVVAAFDEADRRGRQVGHAQEQALLQARLAFVLRQGYYSPKTKEIKLWTPV